MSSPRYGIFVASMTGLAEVCAEEVAAALEALEYDAKVQRMDDLKADALEPYNTVVIVSSTYGHGDIPDGGQGLFESIEAGGDLSGKDFAVFALGDRTYSDTFCLAGEKWDALLAAKGGSRIAPLERHDASSGTLAEDEAGTWASSWAARLKQAA